MALKDWDKRNVHGSFIASKNDIVIQISGNNKFGYVLNIRDQRFRTFSIGPTIKEKKFKTKSKALKFARSYMRKH